MKARTLSDRVEWMGAVDWNRRLFDSLIPLPDGTTYNSYLIRGSEKTALLDSVDPDMQEILMGQLSEALPEADLDYIVSQHAEQDHSGTIPALLERYPSATVICSSKAKGMLEDLLHLPPDRIRAVEDGESVSLGDRTLSFVYTPWVHWPETMSTFVPEEKILFSGDFFGSHWASSDLYAGTNPAILEAAKRYYAEIMMPFRATIRGNLKKISELDYQKIAPSHGPVYDQPEWIVREYADWVSDRVSNHVVIPYISMHGSTERMVDYLLGAIAERDIGVDKFELSSTDLGKLAISLVDAATLVIGTPTVHVGPHPIVFSTTQLANALRPKLRYAAIVGSYGWGTKAVEQISSLIPNLKVEVLGTVLAKGRPRTEDFQALDKLADAIAEKHAEL